jgi:hypothetical protein
MGQWSKDPAPVNSLKVMSSTLRRFRSWIPFRSDSLLSKRVVAASKLRTSRPLRSRRTSASPLAAAAGFTDSTTGGGGGSVTKREGLFERDPLGDESSTELEVLRLGRSKDGRSFFRAGVEWVVTPSGSPATTFWLSVFGDGGGRTGLLAFWPIAEGDAAFVPSFPGSLLKEFVDGVAAEEPLRFKELGGVWGDETLFGGLPEAFNGSSGAAHFLSSAAVMSNDLLRDGRGDRKAGRRFSLAAATAEVETEEKLDEIGW